MRIGNMHCLYPSKLATISQKPELLEKTTLMQETVEKTLPVTYNDTSTSQTNQEQINHQTLGVEQTQSVDGNTKSNQNPSVLANGVVQRPLWQENENFNSIWHMNIRQNVAFNHINPLYFHLSDQHSNPHEQAMLALHHQQQRLHQQHQNKSNTNGVAPSPITTPKGAHPNPLNAAAAAAAAAFANQPIGASSQQLDSYRGTNLKPNSSTTGENTVAGTPIANGPLLIGNSATNATVALQQQIFLQQHKQLQQKNQSPDLQLQFHTHPLFSAAAAVANANSNSISTSLTSIMSNGVSAQSIAPSSVNSSSNNVNSEVILNRPQNEKGSSESNTNLNNVLMNSSPPKTNCKSMLTPDQQLQFQQQVLNAAAAAQIQQQLSAVRRVNHHIAAVAAAAAASSSPLQISTNQSSPNQLQHQIQQRNNHAQLSFQQHPPPPPREDELTSPHSPSSIRAGSFAHHAGLHAALVAAHNHPSPTHRHSPSHSSLNNGSSSVSPSVNHHATSSGRNDRHHSERSPSTVNAPTAGGNEKTVPVTVKHLLTNKIRTFSSLRGAAEALGINPGTLCRALQPKGASGARCSIIGDFEVSRAHPVSSSMNGNAVTSPQSPSSSAIGIGSGAGHARSGVQDNHSQQQTIQRTEGSVVKGSGNLTGSISSSPTSNSSNLNARNESVSFSSVSDSGRPTSSAPNHNKVQQCLGKAANGFSLKEDDEDESDALLSSQNDTAFDYSVQNNNLQSGPRSQRRIARLQASRMQNQQQQNVQQQHQHTPFPQNASKAVYAPSGRSVRAAAVIYQQQQLQQQKDSVFRPASSSTTSNSLYDTIKNPNNVINGISVANMNNSYSNPGKPSSLKPYGSHSNVPISNHDSSINSSSPFNENAVSRITSPTNAGLPHHAAGFVSNIGGVNGGSSPFGTINGRRWNIGKGTTTGSSGIVHRCRMQQNVADLKNVANCTSSVTEHVLLKKFKVPFWTGLDSHIHSSDFSINDVKMENDWELTPSHHQQAHHMTSSSTACGSASSSSTSSNPSTPLTSSSSCPSLIYDSDEIRFVLSELDNSTMMKISTEGICATELKDVQKRLDVKSYFRVLRESELKKELLLQQQLQMQQEIKERKLNMQQLRIPSLSSSSSNVVPPSTLQQQAAAAAASLVADAADVTTPKNNQSNAKKTPSNSSNDDNASNWALSSHSSIANSEACAHSQQTPQSDQLHPTVCHQMPVPVQHGSEDVDMVGVHDDFSSGGVSLKEKGSTPSQVTLTSSSSNNNNNNSNFSMRNSFNEYLIDEIKNAKRAKIAKLERKSCFSLLKVLNVGRWPVDPATSLDDFEDIEDHHRQSFISNVVVNESFNIKAENELTSQAISNTIENTLVKSLSPKSSLGNNLVSVVEDNSKKSLVVDVDSMTPQEYHQYQRHKIQLDQTHREASAVVSKPNEHLNIETEQFKSKVNSNNNNNSNNVKSGSNPSVIDRNLNRSNLVFVQRASTHPISSQNSNKVSQMKCFLSQVPIEKSTLDVSDALRSKKSSSASAGIADLPLQSTALNWSSRRIQIKAAIRDATCFTSTGGAVGGGLIGFTSAAVAEKRRMQLLISESCKSKILQSSMPSLVITLKEKRLQSDGDNNEKENRKRAKHWDLIPSSNSISNNENNTSDVKANGRCLSLTTGAGLIPSSGSELDAGTCPEDMASHLGNIGCTSGHNFASPSTLATAMHSGSMLSAGAPRLDSPPYLALSGDSDVEMNDQVSAEQNSRNHNLKLNLSDFEDNARYKSNATMYEITAAPLTSSTRADTSSAANDVTCQSLSPEMLLKNAVVGHRYQEDDSCEPQASPVASPLLSRLIVTNNQFTLGGKIDVPMKIISESLSEEVATEAPLSMMTFSQSKSEVSNTISLNE